jgi:hypothetical protein
MPGSPKLFVEEKSTEHPWPEQTGFTNLQFVGLASLAHMITPKALKTDGMRIAVESSHHDRSRRRLL